MHSEADGPEAALSSPRRRIDRISLLLALASLGIVGWTAWIRFAPSPRPDPPAVGSVLPPLPLMDLETSEPLILLGLKGKVVWVVFWSAGTPVERREPVPAGGGLEASEVGPEVQPGCGGRQRE